MRQLFKRLTSFFEQAAQSNKQVPYIHEPIERDVQFLEQLKRWEHGIVRAQMNRRVSEAFVHRLKEDITEDIRFVQHVGGEGFSINLTQARYSVLDIQFWMESIKNSILTLPYKKQLADRKIFMKGEVVVTKERYFLKPKLPKDFNDLWPQWYGNITIESTLENDVPALFQFTANVYQDSKYSPSLPFSELIEILFEEGI